MDRNELRPEHFAAWVDWAKANRNGLDFNPAYFSHPQAADNFTLASHDAGIRKFWIEHGIVCRKIGEYFGRELGTPRVTNIWIPDGLKDTPADRKTPRRLKPHDLIETRLDKNDSGVTLASTELLAHRTIYMQTPALAICHCHPRTAIAFSLTRDEIVPIDNEASYLLKKVPIIWEEFASGTPEMANHLAKALQFYKIVMLRGHGSFAIGQTLDEAFFWSSTLEEACDIMLKAKSINKPFIEYRKMSEAYNKW